MAHGDMWAFSETHLCARELRSFNSGLRFAQSGFQPLLGGFPVRDTKHNLGAWKGVGVLSKTPVRLLPHDWPAEVACSSRALAFTSLLDDVWLCGGIVYGEPDSSSYPDRLLHNEALLHHVISTVGVLASGPRFVAGDWNVEFGSLPSFDVLASLGFREVQDIAFARWGTPVEPTCKSSTRKDFLFLSPELQELLIGVEIIDDLWPDHAVIQGHFRRLCCSVPRQVWRVPAAFPWPSRWTVPADLWSALEGSAEARYAELWTSFEQSAARGPPVQGW